VVARKIPDQALAAPEPLAVPPPARLPAALLLSRRSLDRRPRRLTVDAMTSLCACLSVMFLLWGVLVFLLGYWNGWSAGWNGHRRFAKEWRAKNEVKP